MLLLNLLVGCRFAAFGVLLRPPPQAPDDLEELCAYIFERVNDENTEELEAGIVNLYEWLHEGDNIALTVEGYQIKNLDDSAIEGLDETDRTIGEQLVGAAVAHEHDATMEQLLEATIVANWGEVTTGYEFYERIFTEGPECILDRSCLATDYESRSTSSWAGLITVESVNSGQFRWVETDLGWMTVIRSWLVEPATVDPNIIELNASYFIGVLMEGQNDKTIRTSATWIDTEYGALPVDEGWAKSQIVESMKDQDTDIATWIVENAN